LCDVRRRIDGVWVAGAAWVTSDGSSRRRHVTAGGDARRRPVASERERERETERANPRESVRNGEAGRGFKLPLTRLAPLSSFFFLFFVLFWLGLITHSTKAASSISYPLS